MRPPETLKPTCAPDADHHEYEDDCELSREGSEDDEDY